MNLTIADFISQIQNNGALLLTCSLTFLVIFMNGLTVAPNAIATSVATRSIKPKIAIFLSAIFNFIGLFVMSLVNNKVANSIYNLVDFNSVADLAVLAFCSALVSIIIWSFLASKLGIPTSQSHALISGLSGAAVAVNNSFTCVNGQEWTKVILGLVLSIVVGFIGGYIVIKIIETLFRKMTHSKANELFRKLEAIGGCGMAFMHGAQDGLKFMGVFMLGIMLANNNTTINEINIPIWAMIMCALVMGLGSNIGGKKIIKNVGMNVVKLEPHQAFSVDLASTLILLGFTLIGIPVSTSNVKTMAIVGVGTAKNIKKINFKTVKNMVMAWVFTFPGCFLVGYLFTKILLFII